jgi:hypothetical protein
MKFNMGCGHNRRDGYVNVDAAEACRPDQVWNLDQTPWPWPDDCATEVLFIHSLEHMGATSEGFLAIIRELYRIAAPGCEVRIHVPHPRHDNFINDPTHVRAVTPQLLRLFDRELNDYWQANRGANSPLAHYLQVDFRVLEAQTVLEEPFASRFRASGATQEQVMETIATLNNVVSEYRIRLVVRKPYGAPPPV